MILSWCAFSVVLNKQVNKKKRTMRKKILVINKIFKMNILEGDFVINRCDWKSQNGVFCEMEPKGKLLLALTNKRLRSPSCTIILENRIRIGHQYFEDLWNWYLISPLVLIQF